MPETELCQAVVTAGTRTEQPEYCEFDAEPGSDYCMIHLLALGDEFDATLRHIARR